MPFSGIGSQTELPPAERSVRIAGLPPPPLRGRWIMVSLFVGCDGHPWSDSEIARRLKWMIRKQAGSGHNPGNREKSKSRAAAWRAVRGWPEKTVDFIRCGDEDHGLVFKSGKLAAIQLDSGERGALAS